jgi:hypothetical protein
MGVVASGDDTRFAITGSVLVPQLTMTPLPLSGADRLSPHVHYGDEGIVFDTHGWYEVLLRVDWDIANRNGTRFSHTKIPDQEPLHSEAIDADVLAQLSNGRQLLRGNSLFGPDRTTCLILEVWHDGGRPVEGHYAELVVRELVVPWDPQATVATERS